MKECVLVGRECQTKTLSEWVNEAFYFIVQLRYFELIFWVGNHFIPFYML